jgi:hypothetical protein
MMEKIMKISLSHDIIKSEYKDLLSDLEDDVNEKMKLYTRVLSHVETK